MDLRHRYNQVLGRLGRLLPDRELLAMVERLADTTVIEVGGPSPLFTSAQRLPVYSRVAALDLCNYAHTTLWPDKLEGFSPRTTFVCEATALPVPDASYDAVLASHVIEHLANPLAALREWRRVVAPGGLLLLVVPHRDGTFDHRRPVTPIEHLREDERRCPTEADVAHLEESLRLHDIGRDPFSGGPEGFAAQARENARYRALHHHVFITSTVAKLCLEAELALVAIQARRPYHIIVLAARPLCDEPGGTLPQSGLRFRSPFASDRLPAA